MRVDRESVVPTMLAGPECCASGNHAGGPRGSNHAVTGSLTLDGAKYSLKTLQHLNSTSEVGFCCYLLTPRYMPGCSLTRANSSTAETAGTTEDEASCQGTACLFDGHGQVALSRGVFTGYVDR